MAIDIRSLQVLLDAHAKGVRFDRVLMFGRQNLNVYPATLEAMLARRNLPVDEIRGLKDLNPADVYSEPLFRALGAREIVSLDASHYQGSSITHDMNLPIPDHFKNTFDVVFDGGSLEHVFNAPVALKNCMEMVKVGGHLFIHTVANNCFGHGFYQFSPEFFFRSLSKTNGYEIEQALVHPVGPFGKWYEVSDPLAINSRVELIAFSPIYILAQAKKVADLPVFAQMPQQSDLEIEWSAQPTKKPSADSKRMKLRKFGAKHFPRITRVVHVLRIGLMFYRTLSLSNRRFFKPVKFES